MNRAIFYDRVRGPVFQGSLNKQQVDGLERLLDIWFESYAGKYHLDILAYSLATAALETAYTMQPIKERGGRSYFNKYEPGTRLGKMLGNTQKGDGYKFRGEGHVQNTGRRNAAYSSKRLQQEFGLNVDFVANPDDRGDFFLSAHCLFLGSIEGWWTGKGFEDYIDDVADEDDEQIKEFVQARRAVNGVDKAMTIAQIALHFREALTLAAANVVNKKPLKKSRTSRGTGGAAIGGGALVIQQTVDVIAGKEDALNSGNIVSIVIAVLVIGSALYALKARWDDAGRPSVKEILS